MLFRLLMLIIRYPEVLSSLCAPTKMEMQNFSEMQGGARHAPGMFN